MKKIQFLASMALLLVGCAEDSGIDNTQPILNSGRPFVATIENNQTRAHVEGLSIVWDDEDVVSVLDGVGNLQYKYSDESGEFAPVNSGVSTYDVYAIYPYGSGNSVQDGTISLTLPAEQTYAENSFGQGANTMVAKLDGDKLCFKNVGAYLELKLYGTNIKVKSITLRGNKGEQLSGDARVSFDANGVPTYEWAEGGEANTSITLTCPEEGVTVGDTEQDATSFWFVVPPQTFEDGFTITVVDSEDKIYQKSKSADAMAEGIALERNTVQPMAPLSLDAIAPVNEILCYDADGNEYPLVIEMDETMSFSVENFLPIEISTDSEGNFVASGEYLEVRAAIQSITIPEGVTSIDMAALAGCVNLTSVELPESLETIGMGAFAMCQRLESVEIPESVNIIGDLAFMGCASLESVDLSDNLERMGTATFAGCTSLESVTIPNSVEGSLHSTFSGCTSLTEVSLGESIVELNHSVFSGCTALESITIPANIEEIEEGVFSGCTLLKDVIFAEGSKLRFIWNSTFEGCTSLESIILPASLGGDSEADDSFVGSGDDVDGVGIPIQGTARGLGAGVFNGCTNLKTVYSLSLEPLLLDYNGSANTYPFPYENEDFVVYVPNDTALAAYKANDQWSIMGERIQVGSPSN